MDPVVLIMLLMMFVFLFVLLVASVKVISEDEIAVSERLGAYYTTLYAGVHFIVPGFDRIRKYKRQQAVSFDRDFAFYDVNRAPITVSIQYTIEELKLYHYGVANPKQAINNLLSKHLAPILKEYSHSTVDLSGFEILDALQANVSESLAAWGIELIDLSIEQTKTT